MAKIAKIAKIVPEGIKSGSFFKSKETDSFSSPNYLQRNEGIVEGQGKNLAMTRCICALDFLTWQSVGHERVLADGISGRRRFGRLHAIQNERNLPGVDVSSIVGFHGAFEVKDDLIFRRDGSLTARAAVRRRPGNPRPSHVPMIRVQGNGLFEHHAVFLLHFARVNDFLRFRQQLAVNFVIAALNAQIEYWGCWMGNGLKLAIFEWHS